MRICRGDRSSLTAPPQPRQCPDCGAAIRPGVVWFGEALPVDAWEAAERTAIDCDLLLVIGTSAQVYPAAGLIEIARSTRSRTIVINTESSPAGALADIELVGRAGSIVPRLLK